MKLTNTKISALVFIGAMFLTGCSGSSNSVGSDSGPADTSGEGSNVLTGNGQISDTNPSASSPGDVGTDSAADNPSIGTSDDLPTGSVDEPADQLPASGSETLTSAGPNETRVTFEITVPVYVSDALQVNVVWGDIEISSSWVNDESWTATAIFPANTQESLEVTFYDQNGDIILGQYQTEFTTGTNASEFHSIAADQFDTSRFDDDNDGVSNFDELVAGIEQSSVDPMMLIDDDGHISQSLDLREDSQFLIRSIAGYQLDRLGTLVEDMAFIVGQQTTIQWPDDSYYQVQTATSSSVSSDGAFPETSGTVCDGGTECRIVPGSYVVINHTTNERTILNVPVINREDQPDAALLPDETTNAIEYPIFPSYSGQYNLTLTTLRTRYDCELGGLMVKEELSEQVLFYDSFGSVVGTLEREGYIFDQCRMVVRNRLLPDGSYLINGSLQTEHKSNYGHSQNQNSYNDFSLIADTGLEYRVQGEVADVDGNDWKVRRVASIDEYQLTLPSGDIAERINNTQFSFHDYTSPTSLAVKGSIKNSRTAGQQIDITTEPELGRSYNSSDPGVSNLLTGTVELLAQDGSFIYLSGDPSAEANEPWWDLSMVTDFTNAAGEHFVQSGVKYDLSFAPWDIRCVPGDSSGREEPEYTYNTCADDFVMVEQ